MLDASCDRIADGALFGSLTYYCLVVKHDNPLGIACLIILVAGQVISYVKARADSVDLRIGGALAERAERNVLGLVGAGLAGLGLTLALPICLWLLAAACLVTVVQRLVQVRNAARAADIREELRFRRAGFGQRHAPVSGSTDQSVPALPLAAQTDATGSRRTATHQARSDTTEKLVAFGYRAAWSVAGALPSGPAYRLADAAAALAMSRRGPAVIQYAKNLRRVLGDSATPAKLHEMTAAGLRSYARYWLETFRLPSMDHDEVVANARVASRWHAAHRGRDRVRGGGWCSRCHTPGTGMSPDSCWPVTTALSPPWPSG